MTDAPLILAYDHVGLRVTDAARAIAFYGDLGFRIDRTHSTATAAEIVNSHGLRLNLILNGVPAPGAINILLDHSEKWPGYTHAAFIVDRLDHVLAWAKRKGVTITEGPVDWGRRRTCFLRDPDGNVLEFNEIKVEQPYVLILGQKNYSSWSMRAWLLLRYLGAEFEETTVGLYTNDSRDRVRALGGETGLVPVLTQGNLAIWDTLAIFEHLHEMFGRVWPADPSLRAHARSLAGEVHSSFNALRAAMPVNTRARRRTAVRTEAVNTDLDRIIDIWTRLPGRHGPWLFGEFGGVDIMFAPFATRFLTYSVALPAKAAAFCEQLLAHPLVADWMALGKAENDTIPTLEIGGSQ